MSIRVDTVSWIPGAIVVGNRGLGVLADDLPSEGDSGDSYLFNDVTLPEDSGKEICGRIITRPSAGTLYAYEDGSFEFTDAPDGTYSFTYSLYVDGVSPGTGTATLQVGSALAAIAATTSASVFSGAAGCGAAAQIAADTADATFTGSASTGTASASINGVTLTPAFAGSAHVSPRAQIVAVPAPATFSGTAVVAGTVLWSKSVLASSGLTMECVVKSPVKTNVYGT